MSERHKRFAYNILRTGFSLYLLGYSAGHISEYFLLDASVTGDSSTAVGSSLYFLLTNLLFPILLGVLSICLLLTVQFYNVLRVTAYVLAILCIGLGYKETNPELLVLFLCLYHLIMNYEYHSRRSHHSSSSHRSQRHAHSTSTMRGQGSSVHEPLVSKPGQSDSTDNADTDDDDGTLT